jgi:hypothetical protein
MNSPIEILKLLDKTNCKECGYPTCLAFASAVFQGQKPLAECPHLGRDVIEGFGGVPQKIAGVKPQKIAGVKPQKPATVEPNLDEPVEKLKQKVRTIDLSSAAEIVGAKFANDKLTIKVCGKDFSVDSEGNFYSEIHIHSWITLPFLNYIIEGAGKPVMGKWVSFRELKNGMDWYRFFTHKCEKPLKKVADTYTDLFEDMLHVFSGKEVENHYESDVSLVLYPLPRVPILICYWKPEDGLESELNIFFDATATDNLNIESIYSLGTGLVTMFEKIALGHGHKA